MRLAALLLTAFLLRLFLLRYQYVINTDGAYYALLGKRLVAGDIHGGLSAYWSPLYPLLVGATSLFFRDTEFAGRFVSVVAGALLVLPLYSLIRDVYGRGAAFVGALFAAIFPSLLESSTVVMTESVYTLLFVATLVVGWRALGNRSRGGCIATGLLVGTCYLLKPEAIAYLGLFSIFIVLPVYTAPVPARSGSALQCVLCLWIGALTLAAPYIVAVHAKAGVWTISLKLQNNVAAMNTGPGPISLSADGNGTSLDRLFGDTPPDTARQATASTPPAAPMRVRGLTAARKLLVRGYQNGKEELKSLLPEVFPYPFLVLTFVGFFRKAWSRDRAAWMVYSFLFVAATLGGYALTVIETRYLVPLVPLLICWASNGIIEFESWMRETLLGLGLTRSTRPLRASICAVLVLSLTPEVAAFVRRSPWRDLPLEQKQAGLWIRQQGARSPLIMASGPWAAYYAGGRLLYLPDEQYATVVDYARRKGVDYLIVGARCFNHLPCIKDTPLAFLLDDTTGPPPELELVYRSVAPPEFLLRVYRLRDRPARTD